MQRALGLLCLAAAAAGPPAADGADVAWEWTVQHGTEFPDHVRGLAFTSAGDMILAGQSEANAGGVLFLMNVSSSGIQQRTTQEDSTLDHAPIGAGALALSAGGEAFRTGGTWHAGTGHMEVFLAKYSPDGSWQWTVNHSGAPNVTSYGLALAVAGDGDVLIAGDTDGGLDGAANEGLTDALLMRYSPDGLWRWTAQRGSPGGEHVAGLALAPDGGVLVAGDTYGALDGNLHSGKADVFLMKFSSNGTWLWTVQRGSSLSDEAHALALSPEGDIFVAGLTEGSLDGHGSAGGKDAFVMGFSADGAFRWTMQRGSPAYDAAMGLAVTAQGGELYVAGSTTGDLDGNSNAGGGNADVFLMKLTTDGAWLWTLQRGSTGDEMAQAVAADAEGGVAVAGHTTWKLDGNDNFGWADVFLMKFAKIDERSAAPTAAGVARGVLLPGLLSLLVLQ